MMVMSTTTLEAPISLVADAAVGADLEAAVAGARSESQLAFLDVLLPLARDGCGRVLVGWSSIVASTRAAPSFRTNARQSNEPRYMLVVERVVDEASAVELVAATEGRHCTTWCGWKARLGICVWFVPSATASMQRGPRITSTRVVLVLHLAAVLVVDGLVVQLRRESTLWVPNTLVGSDQFHLVMFVG